MPQFETTYFVSQIFWLLVSFGGLYLGVCFIIFPLFKDIFDMRQMKIENILNQAEKLTHDAQVLEEEFIQKKQKQEEQRQQRVMLAQEKAQQDFQKNIKKNEKDLLKMLQNQIHKMEREERTVLMQANVFVAKAEKGKR